jgi:DNA-binding FadR family transcriptional regulator
MSRSVNPPARDPRPKTLALSLLKAQGERIRSGVLSAGDELPTEVADFQCHLEMARATGNPHDEQLTGILGARPASYARACRRWARWRAYLRGVNAEHQGIPDAIEAGDPEPPPSGQRPRASPPQAAAGCGRGLRSTGPLPGRLPASLRGRAAGAV